MKSIAVIVARFQTPYLHEGHQQLLKQVSEESGRLVIVLGVSPLRCTRRNPFDYFTRERMLRAWNPALTILPLPDHPDDGQWSRNLDQLLLSALPGEQFLLYGSRDSFISVYSGSLPVKELTAVSGHSATTVRETAASQIADSEEFRMGINYACQHRYAAVFPTVDIAVFSKDGSQLLLGRKPQRPQWRLPGGFADTADLCYEDAARRELQEECGELQTGPMYYAGSRRIDDWRYRQEADKITTLLFYTHLQSGEAKAQDDLEAVAWFPLSALPAMMHTGEINAEHVPLIELLLSRMHQDVFIDPNKKEKDEQRS